MTPREPDRFDKQGDELAAAFQTVRCPDRATLARRIAAALRLEHSETLDMAAQLCDSRAANMDGKESLEIATLQLRGASEGIRALIPPAAAPAADPHAPYCCADAKAGGPDHSIDCPHFAIPASLDLRGALVEAKDALEQVWAAIGDRLCGEGPLSKEYAHGVTRKVNAALAQIRFILSIASAPAAETGKAPTPSLRKECGDNSPEWWTGRWRDWHRGHGCGKDDGQPCTPEGVAEFAAHGRLPGRAAPPEREGK